MHDKKNINKTGSDATRTPATFQLPLHLDNPLIRKVVRGGTKVPYFPCKDADKNRVRVAGLNWIHPTSASISPKG